jgi:uncharacterized protein YggE
MRTAHAYRKSLALRKRRSRLMDRAVKAGINPDADPSCRLAEAAVFEQEAASPSRAADERAWLLARAAGLRDEHVLAVLREQERTDKGTPQRVPRHTRRMELASASLRGAARPSESDAA